MKNEQKLRKLLRQRIIETIVNEEDIDEVSSSGAAGPYSTPNAFSGGRDIDKEKAKSNYQNSGYGLADSPKREKGYDREKLVEKADQPLTKQIIDRATQWGMELAPKTKNNPAKLETDESKDDHQDAEEAHEECQDTGAEGGKGYLKKNAKDKAKLPEHSIQKNIALALQEINRQLAVIRENLDTTKALKENLGLQETPLWYRTKNQMLRVEAHLINVARIIKELK